MSAPGGERADAAYAEAGVDYDRLDALKRLAHAAALATSPAPRPRGASVLDWSRGEPATLVELEGLTLAVVLECLGTKSAIARAVEEESGADHWADVAYDTVAAAVNDCCCLGALPLAVNAYFATGSAAWYVGGREASLVAGFRRGCEDAGAAWTGGESPALAGVVEEGEIDLAASVLGRVPAGAEPWGGAALCPGDEIVLVASSGLHANGASLARSLSARLPAGYSSAVPGGASLGEALLVPSVIYVPLVEALLAGRVEVHYASHLTGHGLRKVMRAERRLTYRLRDLPPVPPVLAFLAEGCGLSPRQAYGTLNMGAGFALYCPPSATPAVLAAAESLGMSALRAGVVEEGPRRVLLEPVGVEYGGDELALRG